jgi:hypothetical protein
MSCTRHKTCEKLQRLGAAHSAAVAAVFFYRKNINNWILSVGLENGGNYRGMYNLCAGKGEQSDNNQTGFCWLNCAIREFREEFKIDAPFSNGIFDKYFKSSRGKIRFILHHRTPVFIAVLPNGTSRSPIKQKMQYDMMYSRDPSYREMADFEYVFMDTGKQIEGKNIMLSSFADAVRKKIDLSKL